MGSTGKRTPGSVGGGGGERELQGGGQEAQYSGELIPVRDSDAISQVAFLHMLRRGVQTVDRRRNRLRHHNSRDQRSDFDQQKNRADHEERRRRCSS